MKERIEEIVSLLKAGYMVIWLIPTLCMVLAEEDMIPVGILVGNTTGSYFVEAACILLTAICVPLSLKLFSWVIIRKMADYTFLMALKRYAIWSFVRWAILEISILVSMLGYYFTLSSTGALCACIALIASFFCLPSKKKLCKELYIDKTEEEPFV